MEDKRYVMNCNYDKGHKAYKYSIIDNHSDYEDDQWDYKIDIHKYKVDKCRCRKDDKHYHEDKCRCHKEDKCRYEDDKHFSHKDDKGDHRYDNHCKNCVCNQLRKLEPGTLVDVFLSSGVSFCALTFISLDPRNCCAHFLELGETHKPLTIDCQKIDAIRRNHC
ncbi:hypothetical protein H131_12893 [Lysinibacillus sphaericus OT4b.31]|uniref:Uncharacterized protein n=1 Tax=Lysinibacillus sphaericus OT4b.31 TaxID=1285586 RepID=R7ZDK9_LYSSH|nr:hypothetical protein H131_12893 [Lysinibacillus sphaericus OT4b.31]